MRTSSRRAGPRSSACGMCSAAQKMGSFLMKTSSRRAGLRSSAYGMVSFSAV
jgi:hypothetical protein